VVGLSAHQNSEECITAEEIDLLLSGGIDKDEAKKLMDKINSCVFCKRRLLTTSK